MSEKLNIAPEDGDMDERAADVLRRRAIPMGPSPELVRATLARLAGKEAAPGSFSFAAFLRRPLVRIAASLFVVVAAGLTAFWLLGGGGGSGNVAFADVLSSLKQVKSVRFTLDRNFELGKISRDSTVDLLVAEGGKMRLSVAGPRVNLTTVVDLPDNRALVLFPEQKRALAMSFDKTPESLKRLEDFKLGDLFDNIRAWTDKDGRLVGKTQIDGREALEFRVSRQNRTATLWVDPASRLPIKITLDVVRPAGAALNLTFHDIKWDEPFDPALLSTEMPAGYVAEKIPTEQDLVDSLRAVANFRGGSFPEDWSLKGLLSSVQESSVNALVKKMATTAPVPLAERRAQNHDRVMTIMRGLAFAGNADYGDDWHYAGVDAHLGDKDRPLVWYRPVENETYRVIYADLSVRDVAKGELPQRPSMVIPQPNVGGAKFKF